MPTPRVDRYAELCAAWRWQVPARFNIADACSTRWAADRTRFALYWEDEGGATAASLPFLRSERNSPGKMRPLIVVGTPSTE